MPEPTDERTGFQVDRLAFFSDAVFAIAITLLVFNVHPPALPPNATEETLRQALVQMVPHVIGFVLSFLVISIYWRAHHRLFRWVRRCDDKLISINLLLLLCVSFIPCPTAFYSEFPASETGLIFYCASLGVTGLASYRLWRYLRRRRDLLDAGTPLVEFTLASHRALFVPGIFITAGGLSFAAPGLARLLMMTAPFVIPIYSRVMRRRHSRAAA